MNLNTKKSRPVTKTRSITASLHLLQYYGITTNLILDADSGLTKSINQLLKINDKHPQYADYILSSQNSRLCLPLALFHSAFDKVYGHSHCGLHLAQ